ncbi:subtilisin-like protein [Thozetella sp. PMI_491]|nr:subtilisin-like protein [Thozetella sp. PMI_491]
MVRALLAFGALASGLAAAKSTLSSAEIENPPVVPGAYVVEYEDNHDPDAFIQQIGADHDASLRKNLNFKLFKGASIQFPVTDKAEDVAAKIAQMPAVKKMWPVKVYKIPDYTIHWTGNPGDNYEEQDILSQVRRDTGKNDTFSPHVLTQVNMLRDEGITGKGIKIGIIDTGTDYGHPALGGCFGPGCLVSYGYDLVGDNFTGFNTPVPGPNPLDQCNGHGSHVAGIIAAQANNSFGVIGAASGVTLGSFRVFGCSGEASNDVLIAAYNMAYEAGSDIITASIGGPSGWSEDPWAVAVSRIVDMGVPCVVSAGNEGSQGIFYSSTAATGKRVTGIASVDNTQAPALLANASYSVNGSASQSFGFTAGIPGSWANVSLPLWTGNYNTAEPADGCDPYPASTPPLNNTIVLVRRGSCTFVQKIKNAVAQGAEYVIFYNNAAGTAAAEGTVPGIKGVAMVTAEQGQEWVGQLKRGARLVVGMNDPDKASKYLVSYQNSDTGGYVSTYSSWGPSNEVEVKPQFSAPGGIILSTYPRAMGSYAVLSGTSMACPLAAAVYALLMNVRGTKDPKEIENVLSSTARPALFHDGKEVYPAVAPVPQQGGGLIQAYDAAYVTTLLSVSSLSFNDTDHFTPVQNFSISNTGTKAVTYSLGHLGAATAYTFLNESTVEPDTFPNDLYARYANVSFTPSGNFTLQPGQRKLISVKLTPPTGLSPKRLPVYSGYFTVNGSDGTALSLPYLGVYGSMHSTAVLDVPRTLLSRKLDRNNTRAASNMTFALPPAGHANDTIYANTTDLPKVVVTLAMGTAIVRCEVVPVGDTKFANATTVLGTKTIGQPSGFPREYESRGVTPTTWDGKLADGGYAPEGSYKFVVKALRIFGDRELASEYDTAETVPFNIRYLLPGERGTGRGRVTRRNH